MPRYATPLEEIDESILQPVVSSVVNDLLNRMDLPEDLPILFKGNSEQHFYKDSQLTARPMVQQDTNRYEADSILYIETSHEDTEYTLLATQVFEHNQMPVFNDPKLSVVMIPAVAHKKVDISLTITGTEKETERWRSTLRRKVAQGAIGLTHMVTYHYPIPQKYMYLLVEIFNMRQAEHGYPDDTLAKWLKEHFTKPFTVLSTLDGKGQVFAIQEKQLPIQGWFDFGDNPPKPEKDNDTSRYSISFTYSFEFDCPESMTVRMPLVIHNQMLRHEFLNTKPPLEIDFILKNASFAETNFNYFRHDAEVQNLKPLGIPGIPIPWYDDWKDYFYPQYYQSLARVLIQVDVNDPTLVLNLKQIDTWELDALLLRYMRMNKEHLSKPYDCLINLGLWRFANLEDMRNLYLDEDLNVRTKVPMNPREVYHLTISICNDPTTLTTRGITDALTHACFMKHYLTILAPWLRDKYKWDLEGCRVNPDDDSPITWDDWIAIVDDITKNGDGFKNDPNRVFWNLVAAFTIVAHRMEDIGN